MLTIPTLEAIQALDGRNFAMLTAEERSVLTYYRDQGRKFDVAVAILSDADPKELARASRLQADEIMRHANSHIRITIGKDANEAWASRMEPEYWPAKCRACGWRGSSKDTNGGLPIADTGDSSELRCPNCDSILIEEADED